MEKHLSICFFVGVEEPIKIPLAICVNDNNFLGFYKPTSKSDALVVTIPGASSSIYCDMNDARLALFAPFFKKFL